MNRLRIAGAGEFCSDAHKQKYQEEYNRLALGRLLQSDQREVTKVAPATPAVAPVRLAAQTAAGPRALTVRDAPPPAPPERLPGIAPLVMLVLPKPAGTGRPAVRKRVTQLPSANRMEIAFCSLAVRRAGSSQEGLPPAPAAGFEPGGRCPAPAAPRGVFEMALAPTDIHHPDPQEAAAHAGMPPVSEIGVELESSNGKQFPDLFRYGPIDFAAIPAGRVPGADIVLRLLDYAMSEEDDAEVAAPRQTSAPAPAAPLTQARVSPPEPGPLRLSHNLQAIVPHSPVRLPKGEPKVEARVSEAPQPTRIEKPAEPPRPASPAAEPPKPAAARVTPPPPAESQPARVTRRPDAAVRPPDVRIQRPPEPAPRPPVSVRSPEPASRPATVPAAAPAAAPPTGKPAESQAAKTGVAEPPASAAKAGTHPESPEVRPAAQSPAQSKTQQAPAVPAQAVSTARPLFNASATVPAPAAEPVASAIVPVPAAEPARLDETLPNLDISPGRSPVIKIALVLGVLLVGSVAVWQIAGSKNAPPGNSDTYEATPMTLGGGGWATDAATDEAGKHLRQLSFYRPSLQLADYRVEFAGVIEKRALGWIFRMSDLKNYYGMKVSVTGGKSVLVRYAMVDGRETGRTEIPLAAPVRLGSTVKVKVDIKGARFSTTVQDQPADVWTDSQLKAGAFGFANDRDERAKIETIQFGLLRSGAR